VYDLESSNEDRAAAVENFLL
jgi:hypothetical protein